jgi:hypothetical protein
MHIYAKPRRGYCAACDGVITGRPVYRMDEAYCCVGCAHNGPCVCSYEADLAEDGVDGIGLPFAIEEPVTIGAGQGEPVRVAERAPALRVS